VTASVANEVAVDPHVYAKLNFDKVLRGMGKGFTPNRRKFLNYGLYITQFSD